MRHALAAIGAADAGAFVPERVGIRRQDTRRSALDKVVNPDELLAYLASRGWHDLLDSEDDGRILYEPSA